MRRGEILLADQQKHCTRSVWIVFILLIITSIFTSYDIHLEPNKSVVFDIDRRIKLRAESIGIQSRKVAKMASMIRLAVYPGSFDPPTLGHLDVIERASVLFDQIVVAVGVNSSKAPLLSTEERLGALRACTAHLTNVNIESFSGLLVNYVQNLGAKSIVRGLRATADFEYEFQMAMINRRLAGDVDSVFLMTKWEYSYLSSSIVKEVATLGGDYSSLVPPEVAAIIDIALANRKSAQL